MRIGLIGWYGHNNAGDDRILYSLQRYFDGHEFFVTRGFEDAWDKLDDLNQCDYVLLGGGGLILRGFGRFSLLFEQLKPRFGCVGISVEASHQDNRELLEILKQKADFIYVRDNQSKVYLGSCDKVLVGPDLTFLYPYHIVQSVDTDSCGLNLRDWYYWKAEHGSKHSRLIRRLDRRIPSFKSLYPLPKWNPFEAVSILQSRFSKLVPVPLYTEKGRKTDTNILLDYFQQVSAEHKAETYKVCRYFVGMRLHSLIFACQMGVPFISLSYQPKNEQFCESIGMNQFSISLYKLSQLRDRISSLKDSYELTRDSLCHSTSEQQSRALSIMNEISKIMPNK